jgi:hypothetical protein
MQWFGSSRQERFNRHKVMELRTAKLCLDCEEVHADQMCPVCASESFAYLTRWIPLSDRPQPRRSPVITQVPPSAESRTSSLRWARRGAAGVAVVAISQWLWRNTRPVEWTESTPGEKEEDDGDVK